MVFSSLIFLFRFLPLVLLLYYIVPAHFRNLVLLLTSLVFYAWGEPVYIVLMLCSILISWLGGLLVDRFHAQGRERPAKVSLIVSVAAGLGLLGYFKYADLFIRTINDVSGAGLKLLNLALPIGISFYTFQTISYIIDVYRGNARVQKNIISYGAYVTMFPQLIAGPIVQYKTIDEQLRSRKESAEEFAEGVNRFVIGLGKKVLLANNAGRLWDYIRVMDPGNISVIMAWMGMIAYTFQIYFDFSAYSDMAIGLGHMFGFRFLENFDYPYQAESITQFWRRWHISLGTWFREYVYIPLGGNRTTKAKQIRNIMVVWMLTGFWHGADWNFLLWGLYYGLILLLEKFVLKKYMDRWPAALRHVYCLLIVIFGWYIFEYTDISGGLSYLAAMFGAGGNTLAGGETVYLLCNNLVMMILLALGSTCLPARWGRKILDKASGSDWVCITVRAIFYVAVFVLSVAYLVDASYNPFLYFRF